MTRIAYGLSLAGRLCRSAGQTGRPARLPEAAGIAAGAFGLAGGRSPWRSRALRRQSEPASGDDGRLGRIDGCDGRRAAGRRPSRGPIGPNPGRSAGSVTDAG